MSRKSAEASIAVTTRSFARPSALTLGTAQLGLDYGIANRTGRPSGEAVDALLDCAWNGGVRCFDTARAYGDAETRLGGWLRRSGRPASVVSKLPRLDGIVAGDPGSFVGASHSASCAALGRDWVDGYMCHHAADIRIPAVMRTLEALRHEGKIGAIGVSAYEPADLDDVASMRPVEIVQIPLSVLNQAMINSGALERCAAGGIAVFARSIFVQGLAFLDPDRLPRHLATAARPLAALRGLAREARIGMASMLLRAVRDLPGVASIVAGAETAAQIAELAAAANEPPLEEALRQAAFAIGGTIPLDVASPQFWPVGAE